MRAAATDLSAREITILGDKDVPYRVLKKVMATCTDADFGKLSLAVIQKEEAMSATAAGA
jgi:biopolymer transport protein ExbD